MLVRDSTAALGPVYADAQNDAAQPSLYIDSCLMIVVQTRTGLNSRVIRTEHSHEGANDQNVPLPALDHAGQARLEGVHHAHVVHAAYPRQVFRSLVQEQACQEWVLDCGLPR